MEYSLRNKSNSPPSLRQRKVLNRNVKPANILPTKSRISIKVNELSQATSKTEDSDSLSLLSKEDTIGKRLCRRRSTAANLGSESPSAAKGKLGRKSCLEKIIHKTDIELEESPAENNPSNPVNCRVVESACKSEVESEACEAQPIDGDTIASKAKTRRGRKSCFPKIATESGRTESPSGAKSLENLVIEPTNKKSEVIRDLNEGQPSSGEPIASKGKVKFGRKSCLVNIILDDGNGVPSENIGLKEDSEIRVFESQPCDEGSEISAEGIKRRLVRVSKESEDTETVQSKLTRSNRKRKISEAYTIYEESATPDHVPCETEMTKTNSKSTLISSPTKTLTYVDSSNQTETNLSYASISSWEVTDSREVTVESSQTSYSSFCKTKGTQYSLGLKSRSTQTIVGEMVHKGTSTEGINPSYEGDLMVLMLEAVKRLRESRCELLISSAKSPSSNNSINEDVAILSERSNASEKTQGLNKKRCFSSGSKSEEKSEVKSDAVIDHSSVVPISPSLHVTPVTSKIVVSGKPAVNDSFRSPASGKDPAEISKKLRHSKVSCEVSKDHDQPREERNEKKKLRRLDRKEVDEPPISISVAEKKDKGTGDKGNVKAPGDKHETVKKLSDATGNSSCKSTISVSVAVKDSREISMNKKDGQLNKLPEKSEKKGSVPGRDSSTVKSHAGSTKTQYVQRSKVSSRMRTDSGSDEKVCTSSSSSVQKDGDISQSTQKKSSNEEEDKVPVTDVSKRAGVTTNPASRRSSSDENAEKLRSVAKRTQMTPSPTPRRSSSDEAAEKLGALNVDKRTEMVSSPTLRSSSVKKIVSSNTTKRTEMTPSPSSRRSSSVEKVVSSNATKRTEMTPSPSSRRSSSVEKVVSSNASKRTEMTPSTTAESTLQKGRKSFPGVVEAAVKESSSTTKHSAADVFVKPHSLISMKEKRSSGKGVCEAPEGAQKVGNTSKLSPTVSLRILKHQRKSGPSPTASATNFRRKSAGEKDGRVLKDGHSHKGDVSGHTKDPVEMEACTGPDSSSVDGLVQEVKQEAIEYYYSKDDDDDVLSLYPESEYAEMFGGLDNQLSNVSDSNIGEKCPSPSMNTEANDDHCIAPIVAENGILSMDESIQNENEKQEESISCTENVRPEEIVTGESDAGDLDVSKSELRDEEVNDEALVEENSSISPVGVIVDETLPITNVASSEQNLDSKNDTQTAENTESSGGACLDPHAKEELNFSASSQICEEIKEVPKKVDAKVKSDGILVDQQKQGVELVTSSMENDAESNLMYDEEQKRSSNSTSSSPSKSMTETDKSQRSGSRDRINKTSIFKGICYRFMRDLCCRCHAFSHKFPPHFMQKMESSTSLDIYDTLLFAVNLHLTRFFTSFGTACASILSSRKEGNFLMGFLKAYANEFQGSARFWNVILRLIVDCGNCCESSCLEIIMHVVKHILSDKGLSDNMYCSLVGNIMAIACNFKDINRVCIVLDSLEFRGVSLQQCTVRKLLHLIHFASNEADRSRISYKIASALVVAYFLISQEDRELFCTMCEVLKRNGLKGLVEELERKSMTVSNDLNPQNDLHMAPLVKANENSNEVTPRKMSRQSSMGLQSQGKKFRRISETEGDTLVPSKRARVSSGPFAMQDLRRRGSFKKSYLTENVLRRQSSGGAHSQHLESQYLSIEHQPSSSSMSSVFPSWSPVHQYGPNDDNDRDRRDFEAAFSAPLSSPLPTSARGCSLFPQGVRSKPNDPAIKSSPSSSLNEPSYNYWHSAMKKEDGKQSYLPNASRGVPRLIPGKCISPSIGKGFSKFGDPSAETKRFRNCSSPVMRNTPSTASSDDTSGSLIDQNMLEQPSGSSAISLAHLQKKPDSTSEKVLEEAFKKSKWSPGMVLSAFSPWLNSPKRQVQLSKLSCKILEQDYTKSAFSLKALLHCLGSQDLRSNKKFDDIKKILSTVIFNLILRMVISDAWSDAYKFLRMASSANLPIFLAEAFIEEEMSISRKFLVLSEVCFRVNAMDEAIGYLNKGNLFGPVSCWKYPYLDGDLEIQVTFLSSLLSKLASGGFSETAPSIFMTIYTAQKGFYRPVDLTVHVNKVILCALNGSCIKQAYELYNTLLTSAIRLPKTTYRALLIGLVSDQKYLLARNLYLEVCGLEVYPALKENEMHHEITLYSYWQKEEIFIILDNAVRIMYENEVKTNPHKEIQDLEMNIHIEVSDTPEDLSVPWIPLKDDGNEDCQDLIPHSLALTSNTLEEAHDRVSYVLEQMFIPPILYDCIVTKEESEELLTLHPDSLGAHIYERFFCDS